MSRHRHFDFDGNPISMLEWSLLFHARPDGMTRWLVGRDTIGDYEVSTVWMGLDHNFWGGEPLIFETMVFKGEDGEEQWCERYPTAEAAREGHDRIVNELRLIVAGTSDVEETSDIGERQQ